MGRKMTHEEHIAAIAKINNYVDVLEKIVGCNNKVLCMCKVCNHEWRTTPHSLKAGKGCPECKRTKIARAKQLSHNDHVAAIASVNPFVEVLEKIINVKQKIACRCNNCKNIWITTPNDLKNGHGCPKCAGVAKLSHEEQIAAIAKVNPDVEVLGEITGNKTKVSCRCKICGSEWHVTPNDIKNGRGCPKCAKFGFLSHDCGKLYIMVDDLEVPTMMKIGVSIKENERRNRVLKSAHKAGVRIPELHVVKTWDGSTEKIQKLESDVHKYFINYKINFPVKFDGSNEFFYYSPEVFDMVESVYMDIVNKNAA
ncbi:GIY-YIG nuclease family protein [Escherichia coli]|nr:GIY-YIG nuclease family protein [Escherichia coli]